MEVYNIMSLVVKTCGNSSVVEHLLAKEGVASSNLVFRSILLIRDASLFLYDGDIAKW